MRIKVDIVGSMQRMMAAEILAGEKAVTRGVAQAGERLQKSWRGQITGSGLGKRLANTIRRRNYPERDVSLGAASLVYAQPNKVPTGSAADIVFAHDTGPTIISRDGFWLAVPTEQARRSRGARARRLTPGEWERKNNRRLVFVYRKGKFPVLVDVGGAPWKDRVLGRGGVHVAGRRARKRYEVIFTLVPMVRLKKRLDIDQLAEEAGALLPGFIASNWKVPD